MGEDFADLGRMKGPELRALWTERFGEEPPETRSTDLLRRQVAWRLQEGIYGGLKNRTRRRLKELARAFDKDTGHVPNAMPQLKPGTTLTREWKGRKHTVQVLKKGFSYRGKVHATLSSVARSITGTRWSGPVFFGLKRGSAHARVGL